MLIKSSTEIENYWNYSGNSIFGTLERNYGIPGWILTDNIPQCTSKFFNAVFAKLDIDTLITSEYHPRYSGQVEPFNRTVITGLIHYVAELWKDWDTFAYPLTYAYNVHVHPSTNLFPSNLVLTHPPLGPESLRPPQYLYYEIETETPLSASIRLIHRPNNLRRLADVNTKRALAQYK